MKKFFNKAKDYAQANDFPGMNKQQQATITSQPDRASSIQAPTNAEIYRYRYQHGTNLGSIFILEKWLTGSMFPDDANGSAELAAAEGWIKKEGLDKARERFEKHWREYVSDQDLDWLRDAGCNAMRLPIGFFTLGPPYCDGTAFEKVSGVYQNAWAAVRSLADRAGQRGIGVLIDLHGLPGGANAQEHSGTNSGKAEFWSSRKYKELATRCLCFIAQQACHMENVLGIQIVNEAEGGAKGMYEWYESVLCETAKIDASMPIYVSDAWDLAQCASWTQSKNRIGTAHTNPVVIDTHLYWCFSDADKQKTPQQITSEAQSSLGALDGKHGSVIDHGAAQAIVGEYSCVLTEDSWAKSNGVLKDDLVRQFGNAESQRFQQRSGGSFFWTYRMDWMDGGEWGFKQMTESHAITPPASLTLSADDVQVRLQHAQQQLQGKRHECCTGHCNYWDSNYPGQYEHQRFEQGWDVGFNDAMAFFRQRGQRQLGGGDKIGMLDLWVLKRIMDSGQGGKFVWEFEQGLWQGIQSFGECVGI